LAVELSYRRCHAEALDPDEYRRRFPDDGELVERLFQEPTEANPDRRPEPGEESSTTHFTGRPAGPSEPIGKYRVVRRLGRGGQATALLAFDPDLERYVVLKRYHLGGDETRANQALAEGRALARVHSPYTARCLGVERLGDEVVLAIEYIPGSDLA